MHFVFRKKFRAALVVLALLLVSGMYLYNVFYGSNDFEGVEKKALFVSKGQSWAQVVDSLEARGIVRSRRLFEFVVSVLNRGTQARIGKYEFQSGISNVELYNCLRVGRGNVPIAVTLTEGRRAISFARAFHRMLGIDTARFMSLVNDERFTRSLGVEASALEGYLSPNTYSFNWQTDEEEVIARLVSQTQRVFNDSLQRRVREMNMSMHEVLTLASIIEGEALIEDERARISGVYHNRLRKGMRLQADPTIQFIIPDGPRRVYFGDLHIDSPYNTYRYSGLPPGPISNPGSASIIAALYPEKHNYLFFVANGKGGHWFSSDYAGHMNNVKRFRRERAAQSREQDLS
jgi:UPF0755 protein